MEIKITKLLAYDGLELKEATFQQVTFPAHFHDSYSLGIIEKGTEYLSFDNKTIIAHANAVIIINPYDVHANRFFDSDSWKYRAMYISIELMRHVQHTIGFFNDDPVWFAQNLIDNVHLYQLLLHVHEHRDKNDLYNVLIYLISNYGLSRPEPAINKCDKIGEAASFIHTHFMEKISVDAIAAKYAMNKYKFIRNFKKQTGLTPISYQLLHRISKAKTLLAGDMPITDIALETGFYDQSHFIHYFKKYIGVAPLAYKKGIQTI